MELVVDLDAVTVVLRDAARVDELTVVVAAPADASASSQAAVHRLHDVLEAAGVGSLVADGSAIVRTDALVFHAAGEVGDDWAGRLRAASIPTDPSTVPARVRWPTG